MKTKEEILDESTFENIEPGVQTEIFTKAECFKAMESYASDQTQKLNIELSFALGQIDLYRELVEAQDNLYEVMCDILYEHQIDPTYTQEQHYNKIKQLKTELGLFRAMKREQIIEILKNPHWFLNGKLFESDFERIADAILALPLDVPSDKESQNHMIAMNLFQHKDEFGNDVWDEGKLYWAIQGYKIASKWMKEEIIKRNK